MKWFGMSFLLCGALIVCMAVPAVAQSSDVGPRGDTGPGSDGDTEALPLKIRGKDWCPASATSVFPDGTFKNFNIRRAYTIAIVNDPSGNGAIRGRISRNSSSSVDASLTEFDLHGRAYFRNPSRHTIEFVLHGAHPDVPGVFITMRGQASLHKQTGAIQKAMGTFVYERDHERSPDPAVHCFGSGTFVAGKEKDDDKKGEKDDDKKDNEKW